MITVNYQPIISSIFPGGEVHVQIPQLFDIADPIQVQAFINNSDELMKLLLTVDAIKRKYSNNIHLTLPYLPYARQDRVCHEREALSLKVMADLINGLECQQVILFDPHSDVAGALIKNCIIYDQSFLLSAGSGNTIFKNNWTIVCPDAGAEKKINKIGRAGLPVIYARKRRLNGNILVSISYEDQVAVNGKNLIIIDDICDGGRTFIELAKVLKENGANELRLYVTHGIFSKGLPILYQYFTEIYCYHTFLTPDAPDLNKLTIFGKKPEMPHATESY